MARASRSGAGEGGPAPGTPQSALRADEERERALEAVDSARVRWRRDRQERRAAGLLLLAAARALRPEDEERTRRKRRRVRRRVGVVAGVLLHVARPVRRQALPDQGRFLECRRA